MTLLDIRTLLHKSLLYVLAHNSTDTAALTSLLTFCCNQVLPEEQDFFS